MFAHAPCMRRHRPSKCDDVNMTCTSEENSRTRSDPMILSYVKHLGMVVKIPWVNLKFKANFPNQLNFFCQVSRERDALKYTN